MSNEISLVEANRPRAQLIAELCAARIHDPGLWGGYTAQEPLVGELRWSEQIDYWRAGNPKAVLVLRKPVMSDIKEIDWGEEQIIQSNVTERYSSSIELAAGVEYDETISHTFTKTRSLLEQAKVGAEVAIKATVGAEYSGVKAGLEVAAKIYAEYQRAWGETEEHSNTVSRHVKITGPVTLNYEAVRSLNKTQRLISAYTDFTFSISLIDETGAGVNPPRMFLDWQSWEEFLAITKGLAPRSRELTWGDGRKVMTDTPLYGEFLHSPPTSEQMTLLERPTEGKISFLCEYDNVLAQDIKIV